MASNRVVRWLTLAVRVILGGVFIYAAYSKLKDPWELFAMGIDSYHILPLKAVEIVARTLPWVELAIGVLLILGIWLRLTSPIMSLMLLVFCGIVVKAFVTGEQINCGCFGSGSEKIDWWNLTWHFALLFASVFVTTMAFVTRRKTA